MRLVVRKRSWTRTSAGNSRHVQALRGTLPSFSRPLGLDFIITDRGQAVLIELQHGFGRKGLMKLFPAASRLYRKSFWQLRRDYGRNLWVAEGMRRICGDKSTTYKYFARYQPSSMVFRGAGPKLERWLDSLDSPFILAKPLRGSCGRGIIALDRCAFRQSVGAVGLNHGMLLQEYVESRPLFDDQGRFHVGCIRHIVLLHSQGRCLSFTHLPPYWRVSPEPFVPHPDTEALTANISRGASAVCVSENDSQRVRDLTEQICRELIGYIVELDEVPVGTSEVIPADEV